METRLLIIVVVIGALVLFRPAPQAQIMYVPIEVAEERGGLGCLAPLVFAGIVLFILLSLR